MTDTLDAGGLERMVINLVNHLPQGRCRALLCTTRRDGPLLKKLAPHVTRLPLRRRYRFDVQALRKLVNFIREQNIHILHAHGTSVFLAILASLRSPFPAVIWHVHSGQLATGAFTTWPYRLVAKRINGIIAVNQALAEWACQKLHLTPNKIWYIPNFVWRENGRKQKEKMILPGQPGWRIVCLANLRPIKDHLTLLRAMALITRQVSCAHLILIGSTSDTAYLESIQRLITKYQLEKHVSILGHRDNVMSILKSCNIGVLNSISEGFPMTLLEYGMASLPTVATKVGQCPEVLDYGRAGILVPPGSPTELAEALVKLLQSSGLREDLGKQLNHHVHEKFNQCQILEKFCLCYEMIVDGKADVVAPNQAQS
ncbi:MAG: glycosyltransferase [Nitrospirales bacterium]|nr:glycosyltransferase [Nitrospirales bacterium]